MSFANLWTVFTGWFVPPMPAARIERIYVSGPMTGIADLNFPAFHRATEQLRAKGYEVSNPAEINPDPGMRWEDALRADLPALCRCDTLALLPGWENSRGAVFEKYVADTLRMRVVLVADLLRERA